MRYDFFMFQRASLCVLTLTVVCASVLPAHAAGTISRKEGFFLLWKSIMRPAIDVREKPFTDVALSDTGGKDITYAKARGILDDDETEFRPNDSLTLGDALLWLFRSRNVADQKDIMSETLSDILGKYPIAYVENSSSLSQKISEEQLLQLMQTLDADLANEVHEVSSYGEKFHGKGTAFGEAFDMYAITAAHRTLPYNTLVRVTNVVNDKSVVVRINDRGPYVEGRDMDLSQASFGAIADKSSGLLHATFERLGDATSVPACLGTSPRARHITKSLLLNPGIPTQLKLGEPITLQSSQYFVVRAVRYPDGVLSRFEQWIAPGKSFSITPGEAGDYAFHLSSADGHNRVIMSRVVSCPN